MVVGGYVLSGKLSEQSSTHNRSFTVKRVDVAGQSM